MANLIESVEEMDKSIKYKTLLTKDYFHCNDELGKLDDFTVMTFI